MLKVAGTFCLLLACGSLQAATRVALVGTQSRDAVRTVLDLASVKLGGDTELELLERTAIERVLTEQKLSLSGLVDAATAVAAGKLLAVDLFAVVEAAPAGKGVLGLIVFEAGTGIRLWDGALPTRDVDGAVTAVATGVRAAVKKQTAARKQLRTICLLTVRNADLPRAQDSTCQSLALILERQLVNSPTLAVLERKRLELVSRERTLQVGSAKDLLASVVLVELEIGRGPDGNGLRSTAILTDAQGKQLHKLTVSTDTSAAGSLVDPLRQGMLRYLEAAPATEPVDRVRESERFAREAQLLWSYKLYVPGLQSAECAFALAGAIPQREALLIEFLMRYATFLVDPEHMHTISYGNFQVAPPAEDLKAALGVARRGYEMELAALKRWQPNPQTTRLPEIARAIVLQQAQRVFLNRLQFVNPRAYDAEAQQLFEALRTTADQTLHAILSCHAELARRNGNAFASYCTEIDRRLEDMGTNAPDVAAYAGTLATVTEQWLDVARQHKPGALPVWSLTWLLDGLTYRMTVPFGIRGKFGAEEFARFGAVFKSMAEHPHPLIRLYGRLGELQIAILTKQLPPAEAVNHFQDIKRATLRLIEDPPIQPADAFRIGCYRFLVNAIDRVPFEGGLDAKLTAFFELCEFMLARKEVIEHVVVDSVRYGGNTLEQNARRLSIISRALELADSPECRLFYESKDRFTVNARKVRDEILAKYPELAQRKVEPPWDEVHTLLDVGQLFKYEVVLFMPIIVGNQVFVFGCDGHSGKAVVHLLRVALDGGPPRLLGKVETGPTPSNWLGARYITGTCAGNGQIYVATHTNGIYAFAMDSTQVQRLDSTAQLPATSVDSIAFYDGRLYAGLEGGYLVSFAPGGNGCQVLASSQRKQKLSPFDDGVAFTVPYLVADAKRQRILFLLHQGSRRDGPSGLWELDVRARTFTRHLKWFSKPNWGSPIRDDQILLSSPFYALSFDLARNKPYLVAKQDFQSGLTPAARVNLVAWPPHWIHAGWLWTAEPFGRISLATGAHEALPALAKKRGRWGVYASACLEPVGDGTQVLLCDRTCLWLVKLKKGP